MYVSPNFKTKKLLKDAIKKIEETGRGFIDVYAPGLGTIPDNGTVYLEGPHFPEPHKWYAQGTMENGKLVRVK